MAVVDSVPLVWLLAALAESVLVLGVSSTLGNNLAVLDLV